MLLPAMNIRNNKTKRSITSYKARAVRRNPLTRLRQANSNSRDC